MIGLHLPVTMKKHYRQNEEIMKRYNLISKPLPKLTVGTNVLIQHSKRKGGHQWSKLGEIVELISNNIASNVKQQAE